MEAVRLNTGLPLYDSTHATHLYGPLLTVTLAGVFQITGLNLIAARVVMSLFGGALVILLSAILCRGKPAICWVIAVLLFFGINLRTNLILFSIQPDWAAALIATVALYFWITRRNSWLRLGVSVALFVCATLFKQTAAAFAGVPIVYVVLWKRRWKFRELITSFIPATSILLGLMAIRLGSPQMFAAIVSIPAAIKVYPERALSIALYLFVTFPVFLVALWSVWPSRNFLSEIERWLFSALVAFVPISIWITCKSGSGFNSLLFAYLSMTALFVARLPTIFDRLRAIPIWQSLVAAIGIGLAVLISFFWQFDRDVKLLSLRHGDNKYGAVVSIGRGLNGLVVAPQDPTIPYRAKKYFGRSLFFELDTHAVNGNWPNELPVSLLQELQRANHVITVRGYVPTPLFERSLPQIGFDQVSFPELRDSVYTVWSKPPQ